MTDYTNWEEALFDQPSPTWDSTLCHHGTKGQKWGRRRYQNEDGSLTPAGREHYGVGEGRKAGGLKGLFKSNKKKVSEMTDDELRKATERNNLERQYRESKPGYRILSKGVEIAKDLYENAAKRKADAQTRKDAQKELETKLKIETAKAQAEKDRAAADLKKAEAERLKANAEDSKWQYYAYKRKGRRDHMRQTKADLINAKAEKKKASALKRATSFLSAIQDRMKMNIATISTIGMTEANRAKTMEAFFNSNKNVRAVSINSSGKK